MCIYGQSLLVNHIVFLNKTRYPLLKTDVILATTSYPLAYGPTFSLHNV